MSVDGMGTDDMQTFTEIKWLLQGFLSAKSVLVPLLNVASAGSCS